MKITSNYFTGKFALLLLPVFIWLFAMLSDRGNLLAFCIYAGLLTLVLLAFLSRAVFKQIILPLNGLALTITAYFIWLFITLSWTQMATLSSITVWLLGMMPLIFYFGVIIFKTDRDWQIAFTTILIAVVYFSIWALWQYWTKGVPETSLENKNLLATMINIIVLPCCAYYFYFSRQSSSFKYILLIVIFILVFAESAIHSRVSSTALIILFFVAYVLLWRHIRLKDLLPLLLVGIIAFLLGQIPPPQGSTLYVPSMLFSGMTRVVLWKSAWHMILLHPFTGVGLGSFQYYFAQFRPADDISAGYFVHNDFLQMWLEGGLPACILLIGIFLSAIYYTLKILFKTKESKMACEAVLLLAGIGAACLSALFSFDLLFAPVLILVGLLLARLHCLMSQQLRLSNVNFSMRKFARPWYLRIGLLIIIVWSLWYFITVAMAYTLSNKAVSALQKNDAIKALQYAKIIQHIRPNYETGYTVAAESYLQLNDILKLDASQKAWIFLTVNQLLSQAKATNHWDPVIPTMLGRLKINYADWLGEKAPEEIKQTFNQALKLDPRYYMARIYYANYLLSQQHLQEASQILMEGMKYAYPPSEQLVGYYQLVASVQRQVGNEKEANSLESFIAKLQTQIM